jgi:hypothetical protein
MRRRALDELARASAFKHDRLGNRKSFNDVEHAAKSGPDGHRFLGYGIGMTKTGRREIGLRSSSR